MGPDTGQRRRDAFDRDLCPKCGRSLAVVHGQHDFSNVFTLGGPKPHRTPDRKNWCHTSHWRLGDGHV